MARQARRNIGRILTFGVIACCCLTFLSRINHSTEQDIQESPIISSSEYLRVKERRKEAFMPPSDPISKDQLSFVETALEMKAFVESDGLNPLQKTEFSKESMVLDAISNLSVKDEDTPSSCTQREKRPNYVMMKASIIISLFHLGSTDPVICLFRIIYRIPDHVTDDVIITAEYSMDDDRKQRLEAAVDLCAVCRLFFLKGTIYEHRNQATRFAREQKLVFVDARIRPTHGWIEPLLFELNYNPMAVASPRLHLCRKEHPVICDVGLSRLEMTWDLNVIRAPVTDVQRRMALSGQVTSVNQTAALKEVMAIQKDFFIQLGLYDIIPGTTGGEHVSLSLKVLNCGGDIFMSVCSKVSLDVEPARRKRPTRFSAKNIMSGPEENFFFRDYPSESFHERRHNVSLYFDSNSRLWLDIFSTKVYWASAHRQLPHGSEPAVNGDHGHSRRKMHNIGYTKYTNALKRNLMAMECEVSNFRYVITKFQVNTLSPNPKATHYGYVRGLDGIFAFGLTAESSILSFDSLSRYKHSSKENNLLTFTRNSTLWIGPISYTEGRLQFKRLWCVTVADEKGGLGLELCRKDTSSQLFLFIDGAFRWAEHGGKWCIMVQEEELPTNTTTSLNETVSKPLQLLPCDRQHSESITALFVMDMDLVV